MTRPANDDEDDDDDAEKSDQEGKHQGGIDRERSSLSLFCLNPPYLRDRLFFRRKAPSEDSLSCTRLPARYAALKSLSIS